MENRLENTLVACLCNTLHIMLCSESSGTIQKVNSIIKQYPLFNLSRISSPEKIIPFLRKTPEWHSLIIDGNCSFSREFFSSLKELSSWAPIVVLRDSFSEDILQYLDNFFISEDYVILQNVSQYMIKKTKTRNITVCPLSNLEKLLPIIQESSIKKKLIPKILPVDLVDKAIEALFKRNPVTVEKWTALLNISPRKLQRVFKQFTSYSPKKVITLYHAYRIAFDTFDRLSNSYQGTNSSYVVDDRSKTRVIEYVLSRQSQLFTINE